MVTDDTVERAARALAARDRTEWSEPIPWDHWVTAAQDRFREDARAALAAAGAGAGAGAEVDREALVKAGTDLACEHLGYADMSVRVLVERITDAVLAARGDAATPTVTDRQEMDACNAADAAHGFRAGAGEPWRRTYLAALGIEVTP